MLKPNLHLNFLSLYRTFVRSVGVESSRPVLLAQGFRASQVFFGESYVNEKIISPKRDEVEMLINKLRSLNPNLIIIDVIPFLFQAAKDITEEIKIKLNIPVMWGGLQPTVHPEGCIQIADIICMGEGEEAILELAEKLSKNEDITKIQNLWIRRNREIIKNTPRRLLKNLDWLSLPNYSKKDIYYINAEEARKQNEHPYVYYIMTSRGCPFDCSFCCNHVYRYQHNGRIRLRTVENVISELFEAKRIFDIKEIYFADDIFAIDLEWTRHFCREYKRCISLPFSCLIHPFVISKEKLDMLIDAGLNKVETGIQSGSYRVRSEIFGSKVLDEDIIRTAKLLSKYKELSVTYDIIVDNPFETEKDKSGALNFLLKLSGHFRLHLFPLYYLPGTKLTEKALREGIISQTDIVGQKRGRVIRELTNNWRDYRGARQELSWVILLRSITASYYDFCLYSSWLLRLVGSIIYLRRYPGILQFLLNFLGRFNKVFIYIKKNGLVNFFRFFLVRIKFIK